MEAERKRKQLERRRKAMGRRGKNDDESEDSDAEMSVPEGWPAPFAHDVVLMAQMELASLQVCVWVGQGKTGGEGRAGGKKEEDVEVPEGWC